MPKINILDKSVYSLIAAGEVIDKPSSVVKELMENAIDAGSSKITIEIKNGGIDYIRVTDDGCGIDEKEMPIAFMPHTTSKIKNAEDLYNIGTLGFRGEALSTITAVSKVTMISKPEYSDNGYMIRIDGGEILQQEPIGSAVGTTVISQDLFYNIPARRKFLRKAKSEESDITNIVARIILSHPQIAIKYIVNDKLIYNSSGGGLFDAIYSIYGKEIVDNLVPVHFEKDYIKVDGYIGKINYTKPNRTYQTLIVNGRYVINQTISTAIFKAYENYIMKNNFPFYILNMTIENNMIDVNVHPNKLDVKFSNSNALFEIFVTEISKALLDSLSIQNVVTTNNEDIHLNPELDLSNLQVIDEDEGFSYVSQDNDSTTNIPVEVVVDSDNEKLFDYDSKIDIADTRNVFKTVSEDISKLNFKEPSEIEKVLYQTNEVNKIENIQLDIIPDIIDKKLLNKDFKIVGTAFDTYIIIEINDYLYFIDQHAGHERILYDKYMQDLESSDSFVQPLLIPYVFTTNPIEYLYIEENLENLKALGFEIEEFGQNAFRVTAVPNAIRNVDIKKFFEDILSNIGSKMKQSTSDLLKEYLAKTACRHAIKANDKLDNSQIEHLIALLDDTPVLLCPHGRPIVLKVTEKEIEKWFKRIV